MQPALVALNLSGSAAAVGRLRAHQFQKLSFAYPLAVKMSKTFGKISKKRSLPFNSVAGIF
jgi:hypothetical protein